MPALPGSVPRRRTGEMRRGDGWGRLAALAVLAAAAAGPVRGAEVTLENLRVGFASAAQNNVFKVGTWTPVWVQVRGGDERLSGVMEVEVPDDDGTPTFFRQPVDVPARGGAAVV